jgi:hypothetical protein
MKILVRRVSLGLVLIVGSRFVWSQAPSTCSTSKLTDDDVLYVTPAAVAARKAGTDVDMEQSNPSKEFPAGDYFVAALISRKPTRNSVLGNGVLGNFAVDKRSAEVQFLGDFTPVRGSELQRVQSWMRHGHCIHVESRK